MHLHLQRAPPMALGSGSAYGSVKEVFAEGAFLTVQLQLRPPVYAKHERPARKGAKAEASNEGADDGDEAEAADGQDAGSSKDQDAGGAGAGGGGKAGQDGADGDARDAAASKDQGQGQDADAAGGDADAGTAADAGPQPLIVLAPHETDIQDVAAGMFDDMVDSLGAVRTRTVPRMTNPFDMPACSWA